MAVVPSDSASRARSGREMLGAQPTRLAAMAAVVVGLAGAAILVIHMAGNRQQASELTAYQAIWAALLCATAVLALLLLAREVWAQQLLLTCSSLLAVAAVVHGLGALLWGGESWWALGLPALKVVPAVGIGSAVCALLLMRASAPGSRLRYASVVTVSAAVAIALAATVNLIAQKDYVRRSMETLGRFGVSDRLKRVVESLDEPVTLTCAYTSTDPRRKGSEYGPRVLELLNDMAEHGRRHNKQIAVINAANDVERANAIRNLSRQLSEKAGQHRTFLQRFADEGDRLAPAALASAQQWDALPNDAYLRAWMVHGTLIQQLAGTAERLSTQAKIVRSKLRISALPDYATLAAQSVKALADSATSLGTSADQLRRIRTIPETVRANRAKVLKGLTRCTKAARAILETVGQVDDPMPSRPAGVLREFIRQARELAAASQATGRLLAEIGGKENAQLLNTCEVWMLWQTVDQQRVPLMSPAELYLYNSGLLASHADRVEQTITAVKDEFLPPLLEEMRRDAVTLTSGYVGSDELIRKKIDWLAQSSEDLGAFLAKALDESLAVGVLAPLADLLDAGEDLPKLETSDLADQAAGENIVIIEVGDRREIVPFEAVWPLTVERMSAFSDEEVPRRFHGDAAIGSKLLAITQPPSATVVITYYEPAPDPQAPASTPTPAVRPADLSALQRRLQEANFRVEQWNLTDAAPWSVAAKADEPPEAGDAGLPRILLVLPSPEFMPPGPAALQRFKASPLVKVEQAIDTGVPAIFLTSYQWPRPLRNRWPSLIMAQVHDAFGAYLNGEWGIEVLGDYRILETVPDKDVPGRFRISPQRFYYLALSLFTDHPIGRPLQGQRMLWRELCSLRLAKSPPPGVRAKVLLAVPPAWKPNIWATSRLLEFIDHVGDRAFPQEVWSQRRNRN